MSCACEACVAENAKGKALRECNQRLRAALDEASSIARELEESDEPRSYRHAFEAMTRTVRRVP